MTSKLLVATHKEYNFPSSTLYLPIHVGKTLTQQDFGYLGDDTGENISHKNKNFCELTALYWAWKNNYYNQYDYFGLVHYRRYFTGDTPFCSSLILSETLINQHMHSHDIILPKKRKYYIETIRSHYANAHNIEDLDAMRDILIEKYPEYLNAFDELMGHRELYLFNMFVMKKELYNNYMTWLFDMLFALEEKVDITKYDNYQSRLFGFISERLFNVWLLKEQPKIKELKIINIEGENFMLKAYGLLKRKFMR